MTRKDYEKVANVIAKVRSDWKAPHGGMLPLEVRHVIEEMEDALAEMFTADNDRFDRDRFLQACKVR